MSSEEYLADVATRHQVFIQRYGTGVAEKYVNDLERINERVATRLKNQEIDKATRGKLRQIQLDEDIQKQNKILNTFGVYNSLDNLGYTGVQNKEIKAQEKKYRRVKEACI